MQSENKIFDDLSKVATGAMGTLAGLSREFEQMVRERVKEFAGGMNLVSRDEFEAVKIMASAARAEADALKARLDAIERRMDVAAGVPTDLGAAGPGPAEGTAPGGSEAAAEAEARSPAASGAADIAAPV